jgi:hypothetical protein
MQWFKNRIDAMLIEEFRRHHSEVRPHSSLDEDTGSVQENLSNNNPGDGYLHAWSGPKKPGRSPFFLLAGQTLRRLAM